MLLFVDFLLLVFLMKNRAFLLLPFLTAITTVNAEQTTSYNVNNANYSANTTSAVNKAPHFVTYKKLKEYYSLDLAKYVSLVSKPGSPKSDVVGGRTVKLFQKTINNSPFIYNSNARSNEVRYFFSPDEDDFNSGLYLGALYSGLKMKKMPENPTQWGLDSKNKLALYGKISGSSNMRLKENKQFNFVRGTNYLSNFDISPNAEKTIMGGSLATKNEDKKIKVNLGGGYGPVEVSLEHSQESSESNTVIRVKAISKVYSLSINDLQGVSSRVNTPSQQYINSTLHPSNYPVYLSSMDYGFAIIAEIDLSSASKSFQNSINTQIDTGVAKANIGVDLQNAFGSEAVNVTYKYYGITVNGLDEVKEKATVAEIMNKMNKDSYKYMQQMAKNPIGALPLSATFKYLYPKDELSDSNYVKINQLLNEKEYYAVIEKAKVVFQPKTVEMLSGHMEGVESGAGGIFGSHYDNVVVWIADRLPDTKGSETISDSYWWFYRESEKHKTISKTKYNGEGNSRVKIKSPVIDKDGNFYLYAFFKNDNSSGVRAKNSVSFNTWQRSDQLINVNDLKSGNSFDISFFNNDVSFEMQAK